MRAAAFVCYNKLSNSKETSRARTRAKLLLLLGPLDQALVLVIFMTTKTIPSYVLRAATPVNPKSGVIKK